jgi:hypothetical protein
LRNKIKNPNPKRTSLKESSKNRILTKNQKEAFFGNFRAEDIDNEIDQ